MTFLPLNHLKVQHNYAGSQWQDFTGSLSGISVNLREFGGANTASLSFYNVAMDPEQSSGTRVIKKGDAVRIRMENASGVVRKTARMRVRRVAVDIDLTKPVGRQNRVTVHLHGVGIAGVAGTGSSSGVASPEELSNTITGAPYQIDGTDFAFTHNYAWTGTAHASTSTDTPLDATDVRTNLITNPSFETNTTSWSGTGSATIAQSATRAWVGTKSLLVTWPTAGAGSAHADITPGGLVVGDTYVLSGYVYVPSGSPDVALAAPGPAVTGTSTSTKSAWTQISLTFVATSATNVLRLTTAGASTSGQTCYLDGVMLEHTDTLEDYFDGATTDTGGSGITTPTAGTLLRTNLCTNPSFETNTTGWTAGTGVTMTRNTSSASVGAASLSVVRLATTATVTYTQTGLTSGQTYTVSCDAQAAGATTTFAITAGSAGGSVTPNGVFVRASKTFVASGTSQVITFGYTNTSAAIAGLIDAVLVEHAPAATSYFDGDTTDTDTLLYAWTGTADNSTATETATFTEISDNDAATDQDQIILTRDSNPGVYVIEDPEGTIQVFNPDGGGHAGPTLTVTADNYSTIDVAFNMNHIVNVLKLKSQEKIKAGKKGTKTVEISTTMEDAPSIAKYGRFKKRHTIHGRQDFSTYAAAVFAKNADPEEVPTSVTIPIIAAGDLLGGYEDGVYVGHKVDVVLPDGVTTYTCRISRIQHLITPTRWTVQLFLRDQHTIQPARTSALSTEVANNPDGTVYGEHLADDIDATGKTVSNGTLQTNDDPTANRIVVRDDGSEGIIEFWSGQAGETKGSINPSVDTGGTGAHSLDMRTSHSASSPNNTAARMQMLGSSAISGPIMQLLNSTTLNANDVTADAIEATTLETSGSITSDANGIFMNDLAGGGVTTASINNSGRLIRTPSSERYKDDVEPLTLDEARKVLDLKPVTFKMKDESGDPDRRTYPGFIAEQAAEVGAELWVNRDREGLPSGFRYGELTAPLLAIIRDLAARVERLEETHRR